MVENRLYVYLFLKNQILNFTSDICINFRRKIRRKVGLIFVGLEHITEYPSKHKTIYDGNSVGHMAQFSTEIPAQTRPNYRRIFLRKNPILPTELSIGNVPISDRFFCLKRPCFLSVYIPS